MAGVWAALRRLRELGGPGRTTSGLDDLKVLQGTALAAINRGRPGGRLNDYEFRVFSQWGEDGIIQHLIAEISSVTQIDETFIEFGVEDFTEANCRFLMTKDNWRGFVIDGDPDNVMRIRSAPWFWRHSLDARGEFITRDNIGRLLTSSGFGLEPGLMSVDLDGIDYWVLEALAEWRPTILIVEYNAIFGVERAVSVPYDPGFVRHRAHPSGLYAGASLSAFAHLATSRGYQLVGVNRAGNNAFFVRGDRLPETIEPLTAAAAFREARFRESRDERGRLTYLADSQRRRAIAEMPLVDVVTGDRLRVRDLP